jgi:hypothetical protein
MRCDTLPRMSSTGSPPQFGTAEYASTGETCKSCKQPISGGNYYRINGMLACQRCTQQVQQQMPKDTHSAYVRGVLFAIGAAVLGFILFAGFVIITGISLGYISLAVGWLIGKGMKMGSGGIGGRRYQITAAALTYAAVSMAAIPIAIHYSRQAAHLVQHPALKDSPTQNTKPESQPDSSTNPPKHASSDLVDNPPPSEPTEEAKPERSLVGILGWLALLGLASPFLELSSPLSGIIGLVILAVGINIAWKMTAGPKLEIMGPFQDISPGALPTPPG